MRSSGTRLKRKRKRTRIRPKPVLWLLFGLNLVLGLLYSPLTSIRHVRIEGAIPSDEDRLTTVTSEMRGVPCAMVNPHRIETDAMNLPEVYSARLSRNLFGSAYLKMTYRKPVARLFGSPNVGLSADGVLFKASSLPPGLPQLQMPRGGPPTLATLASDWHPGSIAKLAIQSRTLRYSGVIRISIEQRGIVCLNMDSSRVVLGSSEDLDKKLEVLKARMAAFPDELAENAELNLTEPQNPSLIPKKVSPSR